MGYTNLLKFTDLTGAIDTAASPAVTGVGTLFTSELVVGGYLVVRNEVGGVCDIRQITAIASDASLTVASNFQDNANDTSPEAFSVGEVQVNGTREHSFVAYFNDGVAANVTALSITIKGSIDRVHWDTLATHVFSAGELAAKEAHFYIVGPSTQFIRAEITDANITKTAIGNAGVVVRYSNDKM